MEEVRLDLRIPNPERDSEVKRSSELCFKINHTLPTSPECRKMIEELFTQGVDKSTTINPPVFALLGICIPLTSSGMQMHKCRNDFFDALRSRLRQEPGKRKLSR